VRWPGFGANLSRPGEKRVSAAALWGQAGGSNANVPGTCVISMVILRWSFCTISRSASAWH
jgi:hypothetical protein